MKTSLILSLAGFLCAALAQTASAQAVPVPENLWRLVAEQDTDGDRRITVNDRITPFELRTGDGEAVAVITNVHQLSILLQELKRAEDRRQSRITLSDVNLGESAVDRTSRLIREVYWDALTRRIDADHVDAVVQDSKVQSKHDYIYVPASDPAAVRYFREVEEQAARRQRSPQLTVIVLPSADRITPEFVRNLDGRHGILSLKLESGANGRGMRGVPYVVPGGRFNELYYWDSYFTVLGLLQDGRGDLARGMADNLLYMLEHYGRIPNANRSYYLTRSQPPFLVPLIRAVFEAGAADRQWLESALNLAVTEYRGVWRGNDRLVTAGNHQLSRYYDSGEGPCPEVEPGHYDDKLEPWLAQARREPGGEPLTPFRFLNEYVYCGEHGNLTADGLTLNAFFKHDRAVRESGHDTTHRFDDRTADFFPVDLNALLFRYELDFAELIDREFGGSLESMPGAFRTAAFWRRQAAARRAAMIELMWDEERGFFFDYDAANRKRSDYISATGLFPLWAKVLNRDDPTDRERARRVAVFAGRHLEEAGGLVASAKASVEAARRKDGRQWDYPHGWPPHQMLAWEGLKNYGLDIDAERLAYRWLHMIARNARDYNGTIPEKYDVVSGSHAVFVEYGNVGTKFAYIAPEGFGWMNASFQVGLKYLSPARLTALRELKPPE